MKRSEINRAIRMIDALAAENKIALPPFCSFSPQDWETLSHEYDEIRDNKLGYDITDYGADSFEKLGFTLITLRNGNVSAPEKYPKPYAEKLLMVLPGQYSPLHFHFRKMEDIKCLAGGTALIRVFNSREDESIDTVSEVRILSDGREYCVPAGAQIELSPGQSITIYQGLYHDFEVKEGSGPLLLGEVSMCNDDENDNRFNPPRGRFPQIEEDEPPYKLLIGDYPKAP